MTEEEARPVYPFGAIVGQEEMKLALCLNVIDPKIGGVMIMGDRGTGKSTTVRALVDLLPDIDVVAGDAFNSDPTNRGLMGPEATAQYARGEAFEVGQMRVPMVDLPLGATEDRVCGTIDMESALRDGVKAYEPGLLAKANRGILYVDEVNLLDDGLVDLVLDSAASGINTVEREGVSVRHPARFILVGSGNPSEGEMRPQLLDRFGLSVDVRTVMDMDERLALTLARAAYDRDPDAFVAAAAPESDGVQAQIASARERLKGVTMAKDLRLKVAELCSVLEVEGLRGDIVTTRAALALAAWEDRTEAVEDDVMRVAGMALGHRMRKDPLDPIDGGAKVIVALKRVIKGEKPQKKAPKEEEAAAAPEEEGARANLKPGQWRGL